MRRHTDISSSIGSKGKPNKNRVVDTGKDNYFKIYIIKLINPKHLNATRIKTGAFFVMKI